MDKTLFMIFAHRTLDYEKDPDPENWRTIKGAHVHVDNEGKIDGGAGGKFNGKGALPRSMFSGTGKQTEFAEVTEKKKEIAERVQKEKETQKAERRKQQAAARKQQKAEQEAKQRKEREDWYWEDKPESKPTAKGSAAQNLIDYIKEQTNIDLSQHRNTEREKRGQLLVNWKELDRNQQFAIQTLAQKGKFELIDNGGYGYILKPTKEPKLGATKSAENKDVRVKLSNGVTLRWQEVPGEPDKVYNPETREMYDFKGGLKAAIERVKSQGGTVEEYEKEPYDPYQAESKNRQDRRLARSAAATRRAGRSGRQPVTGSMAQDALWNN